MARDLNFGTSPIMVLMQLETALLITGIEPKYDVSREYALVEILQDSESIKILKVFKGRKPNLIDIPSVNDEEILIGIAKAKLTNKRVTHFIGWLFE